jgi:hypothetical protein
VRPGSEQSRTERVPRPGGVDHRDGVGGLLEDVGATRLPQHAVGPAGDHDLGHVREQRLSRGHRVVAAGQHPRLVDVRHEQVCSGGPAEEVAVTPRQEAGRARVHGHAYASPLGIPEQLGRRRSRVGAEERVAGQVQPADSFPQRLLDVGRDQRGVGPPVDVHGALTGRVHQKDDRGRPGLRVGHDPGMHTEGRQGVGVPAYVVGPCPAHEAHPDPCAAHPRGDVGRRAAGVPLDLRLGVAGNGRGAERTDEDVVDDVAHHQQTAHACSATHSTAI